MQIHEITLVQEGLGSIAKTIGTDIKNAVKAPFDKAKYLMKEPGGLTSTGAYNNAKDKYYTDLVGQRKQAELGTWAKNLAGEWSKQSSQATTTPSFGPAYTNVTTNAPAGIPNPMAATGLPQATTATKPTVVAKPTTAPNPTSVTPTPVNPGGRVNPYMNVPEPATTPTTPAPAVAKSRTGGKQPGVVSQTPNAIRQRNSRAQGAIAPGQNAFGQMAQQLSGTNKSASSTGGTTTQMPTGRFHASKPQTAPVATPDTTAAKTAPNWLTPTTKMTKSAPGKPTADEYAKLQQKIAAADAKQRGVTNEADSNVPANNIQSKYAQDFKTWAASKVADKSSGLGLADVEKMPGMSQSLNQALTKVVATQQDPKTNQAAVEQYLLMVGQAMQKLSAEQKTTQQQNNPKRPASGITPLSAILNPNQIEDLKAKAKDPTGALEIKAELGLR